MSGINNTMAILVIATTGVMIGGLIAVPVIEAAEAANETSEAKNKGKQGRIKSGHGKPIVNT
jgi:hypothetical protein